MADPVASISDDMPSIRYFMVPDPAIVVTAPAMPFADFAVQFAMPWDGSDDRSFVSIIVDVQGEAVAVSDASSMVRIAGHHPAAARAQFRKLMDISATPAWHDSATISALGRLPSGSVGAVHRLVSKLVQIGRLPAMAQVL